MNKYIRSFLFLSILTAGAVLLLNQSVYADGCVTQYGNGGYGTTVCPPTDLTVDKQVKNPITGSFVDNLLSTDGAYSPGSEVLYTLHIVNASDKNFATVTVIDTVDDRLMNPELVDPSLATDIVKETKKLSFTLKDFAAGTSRDVEVKAKVVEWFPSDKTKFCGDEDGLLNTAEVKAEDRQDTDTASICVQTQVLGKTILPQAGPIDYLPLLPFIGMGATGIALFMRKK